MGVDSAEFEITALDEDSDYGEGTLIVTDLEIFNRPARPDQFHRSCPLDAATINLVMNLGDYASSGYPRWYVATKLTALEAYRFMDRGWYAYFDGYCMGKVWIDAPVVYHGPDESIIRIDRYGFDDGSMAGSVEVYPAEFWRQLDPSGDPKQANWRQLLSEICERDDLPDHVGFEQIEDVLARGVRHALDGETDKLLVVRGAEGDPGFRARGFNLKPSLGY